MKKILLSTFIIISFVLYSIIHNKPANILPSNPSVGGSMMNNNMPQGSMMTYKDGVYTGDSADAYYGIVQVKAIITGGKISDIVFLQVPSDLGHTNEVTQYATPILKQEAIQVQSTHVDIVSGATDTSQAFIQSLSSALKQAQI